MTLLLFLIGADDIGQAVLVEIAHHHLRRIGKATRGDVPLGGKAAVALTEQNGDVVVRLVGYRQIEEAIEVGSRRQRSTEPKRPWWCRPAVWTPGRY